jgi:pimeloyl-ACP methyl ester carboxylesterase
MTSLHVPRFLAMGAFTTLALFSSAEAQFSEQHKIMLSSSSLTPPGIYGTSAIGTDMPSFAYESYYLQKVIAASYPVVSPNRDLFARFEQNQSGRKLVIRRVSTGDSVAVWPVDGYNPQWFPGGVYLFYETPPVAGSSDCWKINVLSGKSEKITSITGQYYPASDPGLGAVALSPDGTKLAYIKYTDTSSPVVGMLTPYVYDIASYRHSALLVPLSPGKVDDTTYRSIKLFAGPAAPMTIRHLSWSGDGKRLAMFGTVSYEKKINRFPKDTAHYWESKQGIFVVPLSSNDVATMYVTKNLYVDHPDNFFFSPNGRTLAFNAVVNNRQQLFMANAARPNSARRRTQGTIIAGSTSKEFWGLNPWSRSGSKILVQKDDRTLWAIPECEEEAQVMESGPGQLFIQDAQWVDFSTPPFTLPTVRRLRPELFFMKSGDVTFDFSKLLAFDREGHADFSRVYTSGVAADGAAKLLIYIKINSADPVSVTFSLDTADRSLGTTGRMSEDGSLSAFTEQQNSGSRVSVQSSIVADVGNVAAVIYNAPQDFARSGTDDSLRGERAIDCSICISDAGGERQIHDLVTIRIVRPPVVLIHGLWSNQRTWDDFPPFGTPTWSADPRFHTYRIDYSALNNRSVNTIVGKGGGGPAGEGAFEDMVGAIEDYEKLENIVAVRADVITHSMGGLVARAMSDNARPFYFQRSTFGRGRIHKLITIDTPHDGSEYADLLARAYNSASGTRRDVIEHIVNWQVAPESSPNPISSGAIADLRTTSPRIASLNDQKNIDMQPPIHTFVGRASIEQEAANNIDVGVLTRWILDEGALTFGQVFIDKEHDLVVPEPSQQGRFDNKPTRITTGDGLTHAGGFQQARPVISTMSGFGPRVARLLNSPRDTNLFSTNGRQLSTMRDDDKANDNIASYHEEDRPMEHGAMPVTARQGIRIIRPSPGSPVNAGEGFDIEVEADSGFVMQRVFLSGLGVLDEDSIPPFLFRITPTVSTSLGAWKIAVIGVDSSGNFGVDTDTNNLSATIEVDVTTPARLDSIYARHESAFRIWPGKSRPLYISGFYADGSVRDITRASGTTYVSSDSTVATVDHGRVISHSPGSATITVSNSGKSATVVVTVVSANASPTADPGNDRIVPVGTLIPLDATASSDPDGDLLSFGWSLVLKPAFSAAAFSDTTQRTASFTADREGYYVAKLRVADGRGGEDSTYISVLATTSSDVKELQHTRAGEERVFDVRLSDATGSGISVHFVSSTTEWVTITLHDISGKTTATLVNGEVEAGPHEISVNTETYPAGLYIVHLARHGSGDVIPMTRRLVLVR